jgi:8-oxo-dGTP pyrophosphatase MutT (NUDIX family)
MKNPWTLLNKKTAYENPWIRVEHHEVLNAAGNQGIYGKIHFKHIAVGIIPLDEELNTWLVGQYRYPLDNYSWEIPEGGGKLKVAPLQSAKRELKEETGIEANEWKLIQTIHTSNSVADEIAHIYLARGLHHFAANPDEDEVLKVKKVPFSEAVSMVADNRITDSMSVAGILKLDYLLSKQLI